MIATTVVASLIVAVNGIMGGYTGLDGVQHGDVPNALLMTTLPLTPFTLLLPFFGLLLGK